VGVSGEKKKDAGAEVDVVLGVTHLQIISHNSVT
jgi:hypothetical protein